VNEAHQLALVLQQFAIAALNRFEHRDYRVGASRLQVVVARKFCGRQLWADQRGRRKNFKEVADSGLSLAIVGNLRVAVGNRALELLFDRRGRVEQVDHTRIIVF